MKHELFSITDADRKFMAIASELALQNVAQGGGPFGAVIVRDGVIVAKGVNTVTKSNDPTAHAEVNAIRSACQEGQTFSLRGCVIYSSCEPCPMCLSAIYWAGISRIYYGNTKEDADAINFSDSFIYRELERRNTERAVPAIHIADSGAIKAFEAWMAKSDKVTY